MTERRKNQSFTQLFIYFITISVLHIGYREHKLSNNQYRSITSPASFQGSWEERSVERQCPAEQVSSAEASSSSVTAAG